MGERIGFVGIGSMGAAMARNLVASGFEVRAWNRTPERAREITGASAVALPREAAEPGGIVVSMVSDDAALREVTCGADGVLEGLGRGGVHLSMSTVAPGTSRALAAEHARRESSYVAAPVFGRPDAAAARKLWIAVAGPQQAKERARPVLDALGQGSFDFGDNPAAASVVKLAGNFLIAALMESIAEAFALAEKNGVARSAIHEMLDATLFACPVFHTYGRIIALESYSPARFKLTLGLKDVNLALQAAASSRMPMPLASLLRDRFYAALAKGREDLDWSAIALGASEDAGLRPR